MHESRKASSLVLQQLRKTHYAVQSTVLNSDRRHFGSCQMVTNCAIFITVEPWTFGHEVPRGHAITRSNVNVIYMLHESAAILLQSADVLQANLNHRYRQANNSIYCDTPFIGIQVMKV